MEKLFGTDGIRGIANINLDIKLAMETAFGINEIMLKNIKNPIVIIGKDTRISGDMIESAMASAFSALGINCILTGIIPTPGLAFLIKHQKASAGIMISASHNPFYYNGIKIFDSNSFKLSRETEEKIEKIIHEIDQKNYKITTKTHEEIGKIMQNSKLVNEYISYLKKCLTDQNTDLSNLKIAVDCANGSASVTSKKLFSQLNTNTKIFFDTPNGCNINENCGSTNITFLQNFIKSEKNIDAGIALDGDADRCIMIDENGEIIDGDTTVAICADYFSENNLLKNKCVIGTIVSNAGLDDFYEKRGIKFEKSNVGDRNVIEKMIENASSLGGEISGHTIFLDYSTTGDGQLTALQILNIMKKTGKSLSELQKKIKKVPQKSQNLKINKSKFSDKERAEIIKKIVNETSKNLKDIHILVRESGTEDLIRIMAQGENITMVDETIEKIKSKISKILG